MAIDNKTAYPFLKWAGGKTQLLEQIDGLIPDRIRRRDFTYIEPFVGSGSVLFSMLRRYPNLKKAVINDINADLINVYRVIASDVEELIELLSEYQEEYHALEGSEDDKKTCYYGKRALYNARTASPVEQAGLFIFLNRTCFNGLYRVNRKNEYNVPMGRYKRPTILDVDNLRAVGEVLQRVEILSGDFECTLDLAQGDTLFYLDPPYKPVSKTSSFTAYAKDEFDDAAQIRLRDFCAQLDALGHSWILSNSDVRDDGQDSGFFDDLYRGFQIQRVEVVRSVSATAHNRGKMTELLISNT